MTLVNPKSDLARNLNLSSDKYFVIKNFRMDVY